MMHETRNGSNMQHFSQHFYDSTDILNVYPIIIIVIICKKCKVIKSFKR
jgi:hypothetical protein